MKIHQYITQGIYLLLASYMLTGCTSTLGEIPDYKIRQSNNLNINVNDFIKGKTSLIIQFDADCKGCQDEAQMLVDNLDELGDIKIAFVSKQDFDKIDLFDTYFKLSEHRNIIVGQDRNETIPNQFKTYSNPMLVLIDKKGRARKVISGEIGKKELLNYINEIN